MSDELGPYERMTDAEKREYLRKVTAPKPSPSDRASVREAALREAAAFAHGHNQRNAGRCGDCGEFIAQGILALISQPSAPAERDVPAQDCAPSAKRDTQTATGASAALEQSASRGSTVDADSDGAGLNVPALTLERKAVLSILDSDGDWEERESKLRALLAAPETEKR